MSDGLLMFNGSERHYIAFPTLHSRLSIFRFVVEFAAIIGGE